jgi:CRISPR-associated protein Csx14
MTATDHPLPDITLDVDLRNPGQFFACCGLLELASRLWPGSEGWFAGEGSRAAFHIATYSGHNDPLGETVRMLCEPGDLVAIAKDGGIEKIQADRQPVILLPFDLRLDWWLDAYGNGDKSELKIWAGQQTPVRNINSLREAWRAALTYAGSEANAQKLLTHRWPISGRFGFDPSASWEALDVGFSPDEQGVPVQTSPATEILAAVGLQRCRPFPVKGKRRWFAYRVWADPLNIAVVPAGIASAVDATAAYEFPVVMRNQQYGSFGWAQPLPRKEDEP